MEDKKRELFIYYFKIMGDERFLRILEKYSNGEGYGIENVWCVFADDFEEWEDDYFGDEGIAFYFDYPAVKEDEEVILDYSTFYNYLEEFANGYLTRHPEQVKDVHHYLRKIKEKFSLK